MKLKRYVSRAAPTGETHQQRLPEGAFSKYYRDLQQMGRGISALAEPIRRWEKEKEELDRANQVQEVTSDMDVALSEAFNDEALNQDHKTLVDRYRYRAEYLKSKFTDDIKDPQVRSIVQRNWGQTFIRHMAQMHDLKDKYWRDNTFAQLKTTLTNTAQTVIGATDPALANEKLLTALVQIDLNRSRGVIGFDKARELKEQLLHDVEYGKLMALIDSNPLEAYRELRGGGYQNLDPKLRPNYILAAKNKFYEQLSRANAEDERRWKWWERGRKLKQEEVFSTFLIKARENKLTDDEIKYAAGKEWLDGDKLKAIYKFKDEHDVSIVGDKQVYQDLKAQAAFGYPETERGIIDAFLSDTINGTQAADLLGDYEKTKYASDAYKWGIKEIDQMFFKGPFDFGTATVRQMRRMAISEYRERVIDRDEDAVMVAEELMNRYQDWRKKRKSGELLPVDIQEDPSRLEKLYQAGAIGKYTYHAWKALLQQIDVAAQIGREEATQKTGGPQ